MLSNHLILYCPLLLLPSIFPSIRGFSNESTLCIRWPKYWKFSVSISPSNEYSGLISFRIDGLILLSEGLSRVFSSTTIKKHQFFGAKPCLCRMAWKPPLISCLENPMDRGAWWDMVPGVTKNWIRLKQFRMYAAFLMVQLSQR